MKPNKKKRLKPIVSEPYRAFYGYPAYWMGISSPQWFEQTHNDHSSPEIDLDTDIPAEITIDVPIDIDISAD